MVILLLGSRLRCGIDKGNCCVCKWERDCNRRLERPQGGVVLQCGGEGSGACIADDVLVYTKDSREMLGWKACSVGY